MTSPLKPWERAGAPASTTTSTLSPTATTTATSSSSSEIPAIPARPASLTSTINQNAAAYSRPLGATAYGGYGGAYSSPYASPLSRYGGYGGYGGGMYGGYGAYGGYGQMGYGGGMYGGMPGAGDPNDPNSLTNRFNVSTQTTFQLLEGVVGAFAGFAQMLESTYMTTHSSFFAMVAVAEQFGQLRNTLGSILGIFTLMRWLRTLYAKLTGRTPSADATALTPAAFARYEGRSVAAADPNAPPKPSRKPLFFFMLAAFGLPYVMSRVIRSLAAEEDRRAKEGELAAQKIDPTQFEFCRVLHDFAVGEQPQTGMDLAVRKNDLVAVLSKLDPVGQPSDWWRCRARDGRVGYLPSTFLEVVHRPGQLQVGVKKFPAIKASTETRTNSLSSTASAPVRTAVPAPAAQSRPAPADFSIDTSQKAQFNS